MEENFFSLKITKNSEFTPAKKLTNVLGARIDRSAKTI